MYPGWLILNLYTLVLAVLLLIFQYGLRHTASQKAFVQLIVLTMLLLITNSMGDIATFLTGRECFTMHAFGSYFVFALDPLGYLLTTHYVDSYIEHPNRTKRAFYIRPMQVYVLINLVLVTLSVVLHTGWFYDYEGTTYRRGPYFMLRAVVNMFFCMMVMGYVFRFRSNISRVYRTPITLFPVIVMLGGILQVIFPGLALEYAATMVSCLVLFTYVQRQDIDSDFLTGVLNRRGIDHALSEAIPLSPGNRLTVIMLDIDYFKEINDQYGHDVGDEALVVVANLLKSSFPRNAQVGRFGGDEFYVITCKLTEEEVKSHILHFRELVEKTNESGQYAFTLSLSIGYVVYDPKETPTITDYQKCIDVCMYREKEQHHARRAMDRK